jgi:hypothetical protein
VSNSIESLKPIVLNKHKLQAGDAGIYIGRGTDYGNPFKIGEDGTRDEVCDKYNEWIDKPEQAWIRQKIKKHLKGANVICFCAPARCHGLKIIQIANEV